jgi:hypothetical protein
VVVVVGGEEGGREGGREEVAGVTEVVHKIRQI